MEPRMKNQEEVKGAVKAKSNAAKGLRELFEVGLKDIYWAEKVLTKTLPKMVKNASSPELVNALKNHLSEAEEHVNRLEKVFETTDPESCWDGTYKGQPVNSGVYAYKIYAKLFDNTVIEESGNLTVVR